MRASLRYFLAGLAVAVGAGAWQLLLALDRDRLSALVAGFVLAVSLVVCRGPLDLPLLSPPLLYLGVFTLFHLGLALPWAVGLYEGRLPWWFVSNRLTPALALVELALACYLAGILAARRRRLARPSAPRYTNTFLFGCGVAVYLAGGALFFLGLRPFGGAAFFDAGYQETYRLAAQFDPRFFGTSFTIVPIGLYLATASFSRRWLSLVVAISLVWVAGIFYLGFRGYALIPGLVVLALLWQRGFRPPRWVNAAGLVAVLLAIPLVRVVRDQGIHRRSLEHFWEHLRPLDGVAEMGGSLRPLVHTLHYLENEPRRLGKTYWQSLGTVVPNLARRWQGGRYLALQDLPPNHWLTVQAEPDMYRQYGGLGFSAVAEPYMNFGAAGVMAYFGGLGALLARAAELRSTRTLPLAAGAVILGPLLWTTRNSFEIFFRPAVWGLVVVGAAWLGFALVHGRGRFGPVARRRRDVLYARAGSQ